MALRIGGKDGFIPGSRRGTGIPAKGQVLQFSKPAQGADLPEPSFVRSRSVALEEIVGRYARGPAFLGRARAFHTLCAQRFDQPAEMVRELSAPDYEKIAESCLKPGEKIPFRNGVFLQTNRWRETRMILDPTRELDHCVWVLNFNSDGENVHELHRQSRCVLPLHHGDLMQIDEDGAWTFFYDPRIDNPETVFQGGYLYPTGSMSLDLSRIVNFLLRLPEGNQTHPTLFEMLDRMPASHMYIHKRSPREFVLSHGTGSAGETLWVYRTNGRKQMLDSSDEGSVLIQDGDVLQYGTNPPFIFQIPE